MSEWKGPQNRADRCDNEGCTIEWKLLRDCPMIPLTYFGIGVCCPKIRKCPFCGMLIEHKTEGCNNMICPQCNNEFCFICLESGHEYDYFGACTIAPRQINTVSLQL